MLDAELVYATKTPVLLGNELIFDPSPKAISDKSQLPREVNPVTTNGEFPVT